MPSPSHPLPILLIHGFPLDSSMWHHQAPALRAQGHTVLTPDLPGFGQHPAQPPIPPELATIESFADFIHTILQKHGGRAIVGGFSMGGYIMLALLRAHPESIAALMFISTRAEADSPEARAARLASIQTVLTSGPTTLFDTMLPRLLGPNAPQPLRAELRTILQHQSPAAVISAQSAMARRRDQTDLLPNIKVPTLILVGQEDSITPPPLSQAIHQAIPHSTLIQIPHASHMAPLDQPDAVTLAITDFARSIPESHP